MLDQLRDVGWDVTRVNFGSRPYNAIYENRGAEIWHETAASMLRGEIAIPSDDLLTAQLTMRKCKILPSGKLGLESKSDLGSRGGASPDRADALCGAWACRTLQVSSRPAMGEWTVESASPPGMHTG